MTFARDFYTAATDEEIEIGPAICLHDVIVIEFVVTTICRRGRWRPLFTTARQLIISYIEM